MYWMSREFRKEIVANPKEVLISNGIDVSSKEKVQIVENTDEVVHFIIPEKPANLSNADMELLAASGTFGTAGSLACAGSFCGSLGSFGSAGTFGCSSL
ncbi:MAG: hypothetical protein ACJA0U_002846 [Salibacteraceae bacterium]|jgi:hypothetical protein